MNEHTSLEELLDEARGLDTQNQMLHGTIHDLELQLAALRKTKAKVEDELSMYQAAIERVRAGRPAFIVEQRKEMKRACKQRAPAIPAGELPATRADWPAAPRDRQKTRTKGKTGSPE